MAQHLLLALTLGGYLGGVLALLGHGLVTTGRLSPTSTGAVAVSCTGAGLMVLSGVVVQAWPSVGVNLVWIGIGVLSAHRARAALRRAPADPAAVPTAPAAGSPAPTAPGAAAAGRWLDDWDGAAEQLATCPPTAPLPVLAADPQPA